MQNHQATQNAVCQPNQVFGVKFLGGQAHGIFYAMVLLGEKGRHESAIHIGPTTPHTLTQSDRMIKEQRTAEFS